MLMFVICFVDGLKTPSVWCACDAKSLWQHPKQYHSRIGGWIWSSVWDEYWRWLCSVWNGGNTFINLINPNYVYPLRDLSYCLLKTRIFIISWWNTNKTLMINMLISKILYFRRYMFCFFVSFFLNIYMHFIVELYNIYIALRIVFTFFWQGTRSSGRSLKGKNIANPTGMLLASCDMLDYIG